VIEVTAVQCLAEVAVVSPAAMVTTSEVEPSVAVPTMVKVVSPTGATPPARVKAMTPSKAILSGV